MTSDVTHSLACDTTIFRIGIPIQRKQKTRIFSKPLRFSLQEQIQKIKLFKYYIEKDKKTNWIKFSSLGQEPTFQVILCTDSSSL